MEQSELESELIQDLHSVPLSLFLRALIPSMRAPLSPSSSDSGGHRPSGHSRRVFQLGWSGTFQCCPLSPPLAFPGSSTSASCSNLLPCQGHSFVPLGPAGSLVTGLVQTLLAVLVRSGPHPEFSSSPSHSLQPQWLHSPITGKLEQVASLKGKKNTRVSRFLSLDFQTCMCHPQGLATGQWAHTRVGPEESRAAAHGPCPCGTMSPLVSRFHCLRLCLPGHPHPHPGKLRPGLQSHLPLCPCALWGSAPRTDILCLVALLGLVACA